MVHTAREPKGRAPPQAETHAGAGPGPTYCGNPAKQDLLCKPEALSPKHRRGDVLQLKEHRHCAGFTHVHRQASLAHHTIPVTQETSVSV